MSKGRKQSRLSGAYSGPPAHVALAQRRAVTREVDDLFDRADELQQVLFAVPQYIMARYTQYAYGQMVALVNQRELDALLAKAAEDGVLPPEDKPEPAKVEWSGVGFSVELPDGSWADISKALTNVHFN